MSLTMLLVVAAMILDFGLVRLDRQRVKLVADAAVMSGLRAADGGTNEAFTYRGVCSALEFLKANEPSLSSLPSGVCDGSQDTSAVCDIAHANDPGWPANATYTGSTSNGGVTTEVTIKMPYELSDGDFPEEGYASLSGDISANSGCDQLGIIVRQSRRPGLGSLATSADLVLRQRSVGRVQAGPGDTAPAMLLLKRSGCPILRTGSDSNTPDASFIHVKGAATDNGLTQPGSIHADTASAGCGTSVFDGRHANGIVAFAAPMSNIDSSPDPSKPGIISSVAALTNPGVTRDAATNVFGSGAIDAAGAAAAPQYPVQGRDLVTRRPVDVRYLGAVNGAVTAALPVFALTPATADDGPDPYEVIHGCDPASLPDASVTKLFINCTDNNGYKGTEVIKAETVVFNGRINPSATVSMPNAKHVYIFGISGKPAIEIGTGTALKVNTEVGDDPTDGVENLDLGGSCSTVPTEDTEVISPTDVVTDNHAVVIVKDGEIKQTGGLMQLCYTTVIMMGGHSNACLPSYDPDLADAPPPDVTPCGASNLNGTGQLSQTGGDVDWTAPNRYDRITLDTGAPDPTRSTAWGDVNGPEDLAFWSESGGTTSNPTYNMNGGGTLNTVGVYMVPNADPFTIGGNGLQDLTNAQYIASSIWLGGQNTRIIMAVDPNSAVTPPQFTGFYLVR